MCFAVADWVLLEAKRINGLWLVSWGVGDTKHFEIHSVRPNCSSLCSVLREDILLSSPLWFPVYLPLLPVSKIYLCYL